MRSLVSICLIYCLFAISQPLAAQRIMGQVKNLEMVPFTDAWITLFANKTYVAKAKTNEAGYFEILGLPGGKYDLLIQRGKFNQIFPSVRIIHSSPIELVVDEQYEDKLTLQATRQTAVPVDLNRFEWWMVPVADGFDYPFESGERAGYYTAREFGEQEHQGEDWNAAPGDADLGTSIHAVADGIVVFSGFSEPGWGNVIRIVHNIGNRENALLKESIYGHLDQCMVNPGEYVVRGQQIGTMGNANGLYKAHLHLELREVPGRPLGGGYGDLQDFTTPTSFIETHRPNYKSEPLIIARDGKPGAVSLPERQIYEEFGEVTEDYWK